MKVALVTPPLTGKERYGALASGGVYLPPLGIAILAAVARDAGHEVTIVDSEVEELTIERTVRRLREIRPDVVGITATTVSIHHAAKLCRSFKTAFGEVPVVLGGPHVTVVPVETMEMFPDFDVAVIGEGEETFRELLRAYDGASDVTAVKGIVARKDGKLVDTGPRAFIEDLDTIPFPAWDLLPDIASKYRPSAFGFNKLPATSFVTSRGCPARCSFCSQGPWGKKKYREHGVPYLMGMIRVLYHRYGIRDLVIYDGTFGVNKRRLTEFCEALIEEGLDLVWSCNARANMLTPEILKLMKSAGCWGIAYGIESGSQEILDFLNKDIDLDSVRRSITWTKEAGIVSKGYIMVGVLKDTRETIEQTMDFVLGLDLDILTINHFTPFPGTLDYERAHLYGSFTRDWRLLNEHNLVFVPHGMTRGEIEHAIRLITRRFYLRPRVIARYALMLGNPHKLRLIVKGLVALLKFIAEKPGRG